MAKKRKKEKRPSAAQSLAQIAVELRTINARYAGCFELLNDPNEFPAMMLTRESVPVTIERDMKAGETLHVALPLKIKLGRPR